MAIERDPDLGRTYNNWGFALQNLERYEEAIDKYKQAIEREPDLVLAYNNWGDVLLDLERPEEANAMFAFARCLQSASVGAHDASI